jgi:hypothetical protein
MMRMRWLFVVAGACVLAACSGSPTNPSDDGPGSGSGGGGGGGGQTITCPQHLGTATRAQGTMTASINGVAWTADCIAVLANTTTIISVAGADLASGIAFQTLGFATGNRAVGTQTITPVSTINANLQQGANGWHASLAQGSGTLVFTTLTTNRAVGTFSFVLLPVPGGPATGTKTVTGSFNLTF